MRITTTLIRKIYKLSTFDPKEIGTEWHIAARDMTHIAHLNRAKQLITFYLEGAKGVEIIHTAIWHLGCSMVRYYQEAEHEAFCPKKYKATRGVSRAQNNENAKGTRVERRKDAR